MKKLKLEIIGLSYSQTQSGAYALVLGEEKGKRRLPIHELPCMEERIHLSGNAQVGFTAQRSSGARLLR